MNLLRWFAKKWARAGVALTSSTLSAPRRLLGRSDGSGVRVLTYHRFGHAGRDPFCIAVADFERQMAWLADRGLAVSLPQVESFVGGGETLPDGSVLVTVDDGCPSLHALALPVLKRYAIPAVAFIPVGEILSRTVDAAPSAPEPPDARLSWAQLESLLEAGVTLGAHGWTHRSLGRMSPAEIHEQVERSRETLEWRTGQRVTSFAYPFGTRADFNGTTAAMLRAAGYRSAFTSQHGVVRTGGEPLELPRVKVEGGDGFWMFRLLLEGGLDGWRWVDRTMWRLQASGA